MDKIKSNKPVSIILITIIYIAASALGIWVYLNLPFAPWASLLLADAAATVFVFIFSVIFRNASVYDPYWSVQPIVIAICFAVSSGVTSATVLLLISFICWGVRLTYNWAYVFGGLGSQDWRYTKLKEDTGIFYPFVNLFGIHMMPTLIVYLCVLPVVCAEQAKADINLGSITGMVICLGAAFLQLAADTQMHRFRKIGSKGLIRTGLWKYSRHPNYLGEILMWWGIAIQALSVLPGKWLLMSGAAVNTLMFLTISIPLADKRQSAKSGYEEYRRSTRSLLPIPRHV